MKRILALMMVLALCAMLFAGCGEAAPAEESETIPESESEPVNEETSEPASEEESEGEEESEEVTDDTTIRIGGLKGPTSMGLVKLMEDASVGDAKNNYEFTIAAAADELTPKLIRGEIDMVAVPANLASVLYNKTEGAVEVLAVNTLGVVYIVDKNEEISSVADLKGKTIYATGKGTIPEYALRYVLSQNGLDPDTDVTMEWKSEPTEVVAHLTGAEAGVAMLPQPFVTVAQGSVEGLEVSLNLTEEWNNLGVESTLITGVMVARREFVEEHTALVNAFLEEYKASTEYANSDVAEAAKLVEKYGIVKAAVAEKAMPHCNIVFVAGDDMKAALPGFLAVLHAEKPESVGGKLPGEDFYYCAE